MPAVAHLYFRTAIIFLIVGVAVGLHMAIAEDHSAFPAHAHINLLGWVTSAIFGGYYALNPAKAGRRIARVQYVVYLAGLVVMLPALYLKYAVGVASVEPILAIGSLIVTAGVLIFAFVVFAGEKEAKTLSGSSLAAA